VQYHLAFLQNNTAVMEQKFASLRGKPQEDWQFSAQSDTEAYYGRLQAVDSAKRNDAKEIAARYEAGAALREAEFGNLGEPRRQLAIFPRRRACAMAGGEASQGGVREVQ
jgi:hypothetical protein